MTAFANEAYLGRMADTQNAAYNDVYEFLVSHDMDETAAHDFVASLDHKDAGDLGRMLVDIAQRGAAIGNARLATAMNVELSNARPF